MHDRKRTKWPEELLSLELFGHEYRILAPVEKEVLGLRIQGYSSREISVMLGRKIQTIWNHVRNIRYKYRNGVRDRVDNLRTFRKYPMYLKKIQRIVKGDGNDNRDN